MRWKRRATPGPWDGSRSSWSYRSRSLAGTPRRDGVQLFASAATATTPASSRIADDESKLDPSAPITNPTAASVDEGACMDERARRHVVAECGLGDGTTTTSGPSVSPASCVTSMGRRGGSSPSLTNVTPLLEDLYDIQAWSTVPRRARHSGSSATTSRSAEGEAMKTFRSTIARASSPRAASSLPPPSSRAGTTTSPPRPWSWCRRRGGYGRRSRADAPDAGGRRFDASGPKPVRRSMPPARGHLRGHAVHDGSSPVRRTTARWRTDGVVRCWGDPPRSAVRRGLRTPGPRRSCSTGSMTSSTSASAATTRASRPRRRVVVLRSSQSPSRSPSPASSNAKKLAIGDDRECAVLDGRRARVLGQQLLDGPGSRRRWTSAGDKAVDA